VPTRPPRRRRTRAGRSWHAVRRGRRRAHGRARRREGATFCVWEARASKGAQLVNEPGTWNFSALNTRDLGRAGGDVNDGEEAVRAYFAERRRAFPDPRNEVVALHHAEDAVIVEVDVLGTQLGPLRALPPTGRAFRWPHECAFPLRD
jgi:ketosteroid isomerase-like protein